MTGQPPPTQPPGWPAAAAPPPGWTPPPLGWSPPASFGPQAAPPAPWAMPPAGPAPAPLPAAFAPPPAAFAPPASRPRRPIALGIGVAVLVVAAVAVGFWALRGGLNPSVTPAPGVPTAPIGVNGGDIGTPVTLTGPDGTATVTATTAVWTPEGDLAPEPGTSYLIVDVEVTGVSGEVSVGGVFTVAVAKDGSRHSLAYGPVLIPLLASTRLQADDTASGQLGYQLPPGAVRIEFQDPGGTVLGSLNVPGP